jgi:hypothetical protein
MRACLGLLAAIAALLAACQTAPPPTSGPIYQPLAGVECSTLRYKPPFQSESEACSTARSGFEGSQLVTATPASSKAAAFAIEVARFDSRSEFMRIIQVTGGPILAHEPRAFAEKLAPEHAARATD